MIKVKMKRRKAPFDEIVTDIPLELHHTWVPQRCNDPTRHLPENLTIVNRWAHEAMDEFRHAGWYLIKIIQGPNSWGT